MTDRCVTIRQCLNNAGLCVVVALAFTIGASVSVATEPPQSLNGRSYVGMEGTHFFRYKGPTLKAKGVTDRDPIVLRIASISEVDGGLQYELRYIGNTPGDYDLRDFIERADGGTTENVETMPVTILGLLSDDHDGAIAEVSQPAIPMPGGYFELEVAAVVLWFIPFIALLVWWFIKRDKPQEVRVVRGPTLADQLRPLVQSAVKGDLPTEGRAHLERLLIQYWRGRLHLGSLPPADALRQMKDHDEAGALLRQLEQWLHARPNPDRQAETDNRIAELLRPYERIAAIENPTRHFESTATVQPATA